MRDPDVIDTKQPLRDIKRLVSRLQLAAQILGLFDQRDTFLQTCTNLCTIASPPCIMEICFGNVTNIFVAE
jgi:hypothetical protein